MKTLLLLFTVLFLVTSCNKENRFSKKLIKGEAWIVSNLVIDGNSIGVSGIWEVTQDVNIYDSVPSIQWSNANQSTQFQWQFSEKGKVFEISSQSEECTTCTELPSELELLCYLLSGKYSVLKNSKKLMTFESQETNGYPDKTVQITIERI